jgi:hypothetical protein
MKIKMCLFLIMGLNFICFSQTEDKPKDIYYSEKIILSLLVDGVQKYIDTVFIFRNYVDSNDEKRILYNDLEIDREIDKLIWECKYITVYLQYQNNLNKFSIISYRLDNQNRIIASYFLCNRESRKIVEMMRFQVENKKIIGINVLPGIYEDFIPIDEYEKGIEESIDMHWKHHRTE